MVNRLLIIVFTACMLPSLAWGGQIEWKAYIEAFQMANQVKKPVFLYFRSKRCKFCDKLDKETFTDQKVIDYINSNFIPVRISESSDRRLIKKFEIRGYPDNRFYDQKGNHVFQFYGFQPPKVFMVFLEFVATESYKTMDVKQYYESKQKKDST